MDGIGIGVATARDESKVVRMPGSCWRPAIKTNVTQLRSESSSRGHRYVPTDHNVFLIYGRTSNENRVFCLRTCPEFSEKAACHAGGAKPLLLQAIAVQLLV